MNRRVFRESFNDLGVPLSQVYGWEQKERVKRDEEAAEAEERAAAYEVDQKKRDERRAILLARASGDTEKRIRVGFATLRSAAQVTLSHQRLGR